ncbi:SAM-dependent methyltransferase [Desulfococcus multivorans]|uniref:Methyltransferase n=1 Tax=Desulfococcus multivorans DSM 2059 TaxID=1121405 RepID=S7TKB1_DESML|nr:class I SAM-dependent methyltransferase [Desulfococcus multivorans]AOY57237.1 methyltransferase, type 12 [Desulfococcus multivorans]AQU99699.1 methyltransferase [Desulfococcus multivorans]EPR37271.1 methyltransferase [Desulfococcus multivorans DSM 2059]SKA25974.1 Methyltransferase domain-containing protein [Desulfococcus multivorans DSM 2059]
MDMWKFYDITHREHVVCNPVSEEKLARLVALLRLPTGAQVVDIACGKGEFLIRLAEAYGARGAGIDISPFFIAEAERRIEIRASGAGITFTQMNGADFKPDEPEGLDLASCIGASWVFGGHANTLEALIRMVKPGGWVIVGEPYWRREPSGDYLEASGIAEADFGSHFSNAEAGERRGLDLVHAIVSNTDDWDRYEGLQWYATADYARTHPDDPDLATVVERVEKDKATYLRWGRDTLGWAIYMFRRRTPRLPSGTSLD